MPARDSAEARLAAEPTDAEPTDTVQSQRRMDTEFHGFFTSGSKEAVSMVR